MKNLSRYYIREMWDGYCFEPFNLLYSSFYFGHISFKLVWVFNYCGTVQCMQD